MVNEQVTSQRSKNKAKGFVLLMSVFMFAILFLVNLLRVLKESLLIAHVGVESLSYIRVLLELPLSLLIIYVLTKLKKRYTQQRVFNLVLWFYIAFMLVFTYILHPYTEALHLPAWLKYNLLQVAPILTKLIVVIDLWPITFLYLFSDLWPLLIYVNCFWELSNRLVSTQDATKIYPLYNIVGQSNILFTGILLYYLSSISIKQYIHALGFDFVQCVGSTALLIMIVVVLLYNYIVSKYDTPREACQASLLPKKKLLFKETVKLLWNNKHIANIFFCTLLYYTTICIIETLWFHTLAVHYATTSLIGNYQAQTLLVTGASTLFFALIATTLLKKFGWHFVLQLLPCTMLLFSLAWLNFTSACTPYLPLTTLYLSSGMYVLAKSMKYAFFDSTKEMAYIPVEDGLKFYGKLSADTLANSMGKVIGNIFPITFFTFYWERNFDKVAAFYLSFLLVLLNSCWIYAARRLNNSYQNMLLNNVNKRRDEPS